MNSLTVVILSRNIANLQPCLAAILEHNPEVNIVVVDDGIEYGHAELFAFVRSHALIVKGEKPFIFARNVNLGIAATAPDDVIVLNDDALLQTPGGFTALQREAYAHPEFGVISSSCNNVGNTNQNRRRGGELREDPRMVCFVATLIPRSTIDKVGLLDERFVDYGMDDDDYCERVRRAGLKIGIFDGCFVDHSKLVSTFRDADNNNHRGGDFRPNLRRYIEKWGVDNRGMDREHSPWKALFPAEVGAAK